VLSTDRLAALIGLVRFILTAAAVAETSACGRGIVVGLTSILDRLTLFFS